MTLILLAALYFIINKIEDWFGLETAGIAFLIAIIAIVVVCAHFRLVWRREEDKAQINWVKYWANGGPDQKN